MRCPDHRKTDMVCEWTRYGIRYRCPEPLCTVACWDGSTSTPANAETRALRQRCHELFDPLWQTRSHFRSRTDAYRWMATIMGCKVSNCHIGMFSKEGCLKLISELEKL